MPPRPDLFRFWQRWLQCVSAGSALVGLVFLLAPDAAVLAGYNRQVIEAFHGAAPPPEALGQQHWALAVLGSAMLGWGLLLTWVATIPFGRREAWAWRAMALSVGAWVIGDTVVSYRAGISLEVLWNAIVVVVIALPLAMTYRSVVSGAASAGAAAAPTSAPRRVAQ